MASDALSPLTRILDSDLCVIGPGPPGITVATELRHSGQSIVLLESGTGRPQLAIQRLSAARRAVSPTALSTPLAKKLEPARCAA